MFRTAPAPTRASNSFTIGFGLLNIPVSVLTGTEETAVKRSEFVTVEGALHPVGRVPYDKVTNEVIEDAASNVVRHAHDEASGKDVPLSDDEIAACTMPKGIAEIVSFVPLSKLHQSYLTIGLAQVRARTSGLKEAQKAQAQRAFGLLLTGMREAKVVALVKVALRGPARFAAITPDGDLLWLQASDGIREAQPMTPQVYSDNELSLVSTLIDTIGKGTPVITDDTAAKITEYVASKAAGVDTPVSEPLAEPTQIDMMSVLSASIDAAKAGRTVAS
jgi:non-homologous end joining protein Ku